MLESFRQLFGLEPPDLREVCFQCHTKADQHPIVGIMQYDDEIIGRGLSVGVDPAKAWMAVPVCPSCHRAPRLKAHYFYRKDMPTALRMAGTATLGG
jgi:uncharacterized CHY-type Zn-finger protein